MRTKKRRSVQRVRLLACAGVAASLGLVGCGSSSGSSSTGSSVTTAMLSTLHTDLPGVPDSLLTKACKEGTLNALLLPLTNQQTLDNDFQKMFPCIKVKAVLDSGGTLVTRFESGIASGDPADVIQMTDLVTANQLASKGSLLPYQVVNAKQLTPNANGDYWPNAYSLSAISFNTKKISPAKMAQIKTWADLSKFTDSDFNGASFGISSSFDGASGAAFVTWDAMVNLAGKPAITKLYQDRTVHGYSGSGDAIAAMTSGAIDVYIGAEAKVQGAVQSGAPVQIIYPTPVAQSPIVDAIAAKAKDPAAGELYQEFLTSKYGQGLTNTVTLELPVLPGVPDERAVAKQPWFNIPSDLKPFDVNALSSEFNDLNSFFKTLPKK